MWEKILDRNPCNESRGRNLENPSGGFPPFFLSSSTFFWIKRTTSSADIIRPDLQNSVSGATMISSARIYKIRPLPEQQWIEISSKYKCSDGFEGVNEVLMEGVRRKVDYRDAPHRKKKNKRRAYRRFFSVWVLNYRSRHRVVGVVYRLFECFIYRPS